MKTQTSHKIIRFHLPVVLAVVLGGMPLAAQVRASDRPSCLEQAVKKIRPESKITLFPRDYSEVKGRLVSIELDQSLLTMSSRKGNDTVLQSYSISDISKIEYNGGGRLKRMLLGLLIGGGLGALVGSTGESDCAQEFGCIEGFPTAGGAILGGIIGLSIGLALPSTRVIECR